MGATKEKRRIREKHFIIQNGKCFWCEKQCIFPPRKKWDTILPENTAVLVAVQPNSMTGKYDDNSYVMACKQCERERHDFEQSRTSSEQMIEQRLTKKANGIVVRGKRVKGSTKLVLWKKQNGRCYWCLTLCVLPKDGQRRKRWNTATADHLRVDKMNLDGESIVMACNKCNGDRQNDLTWTPGCRKKDEGNKC